jgi:hypothetical protein
LYSLVLHACNLVGLAVWAYYVNAASNIFTFVMELLVGVMYAVTIYYTYEIWQMCPANDRLLEQCLGRQQRNQKEFIIH